MPKPFKKAIQENVTLFNFLSYYATCTFPSHNYERGITAAIVHVLYMCVLLLLLLLILTCQYSNSLSLECVPDITVEVVITSQEQPATLTKGNTSDPAYYHLI